MSGFHEITNHNHSCSLGLDTSRKMLTKVELKTVVKVLKLPCRIWLLPFNWDPTSFRLYQTTSKLQNSLIFVLYFLNTLYLVFIAYKLRATLYKKNANEILYHFCHLGTFAATAVLKYNLWQYRHEVIQLVNETIECNFEFGTHFVFGIGKLHLLPVYELSINKDKNNFKLKCTFPPVKELFY
jgi:hypothetical protein